MSIGADLAAIDAPREAGRGGGWLGPFVRFGLVGAAGSAAYVALSWLLAVLGMTLWVASLSAYAAFIPAMYAAQRSLAFRSSAPHARAFPRYVATQGVGLGTAVLLPVLASPGAGLPPAATFALVAVAAPALNFVLLRLWAFHEPEGWSR